jgi:hypothetical protein
VRCINIRSYIDRLQRFLRKLNKPSSVPFDSSDTAAFINKISTTNLYHLDMLGHLRIQVTDLLFYELKQNNALLLIVGTTAGLFVIRYREKHEQAVMQLPLPKSLWTVSEHIESVRSIDYGDQRLIMMNVLGLDHIYAFQLEQAFTNHAIQFVLSIPNPARRFATRLAVHCPTASERTLFECWIGSNTGSISQHCVRRKLLSQDDELECTSNELPWSIEPTTTTLTTTAILSISVNERYLVSTTNNNLIFIYRRR